MVLSSPPISRHRSRTGPVRVASVPSSHVYVRHLASEDGGSDRVRRLPDPPRTTDGGPAWWPPVMLDPDWIRAHREDFDLLHVHFGFDALTPEELAGVVGALRETGKPLVQTVHDLRNPHHLGRGLHDEQLDVLVPAADALVTLTPGATDEIARRWGRTATVLAHPHVVDLDEMARRARTRRAPRETGSFRVGLHVKSLRACMDPRAVLPTLVDAVGQLPGGVLQVDGHTDVLDPGGARFDPELSALLTAAPDHVDVRVHDFFSDAELVDYLAGLDLSVLPYRFGTHSGWLEACRDVGTPVAAPTCGYYAQQAPVHSFTLDEQRFEPDELAEAVRQAYEEPPLPAPDPGQRRRERADLDAAHARIYAEVLGA